MLSFACKIVFLSIFRFSFTLSFISLLINYVFIYVLLCIHLSVFYVFICLSIRHDIQRLQNQEKRSVRRNTETMITQHLE